MICNCIITNIDDEQEAVTVQIGEASITGLEYCSGELMIGQVALVDLSFFDDLKFVRADALRINLDFNL